jgi:competence protein CoiA
MLCAKRKLTGEIVTAYFANKSQAPFSCPECNDPVILKTGKSRINYFAHENPLACKFAGGESEAHENCKMQIFAALKQHPNVSNAALERPLGTNRPDVSATINGVPVAIEVQISSLSLDTITRRTIEYARKGIYVLWLLQWTPELNFPRYTPQLWEKWIHAAYFGRVYYWLEKVPDVCDWFVNNWEVGPCGLLNANSLRVQAHSIGFRKSRKTVKLAGNGKF